MRSAMQCHALRLKPGQEVASSLRKYVKDNGLQAAFVLTCVGSLERARIRLANKGAMGDNQVVELNERHEIVSLVGTIDPQGMHLHIFLGDGEGRVVGGHVLGDLVVFTTAEIVLGECADLAFTRELDDCTGFPELVVSSRPEIEAQI